MSLYGVLGLDNSRSVSNELHDMLKLSDYDTGRYRDMYLSKDGTRIILLTRNGGGNREWQEDSIKSLQSHPLYRKDRDCDWDETYAEFFFTVPEEHADRCKELIRLTNGEAAATGGEKFGAFLDALAGGKIKLV